MRFAVIEDNLVTNLIVAAEGQKEELETALNARLEDAAGYGLRRFSMERPEAHRIALVVGPEGGMSPEEVHAMEEVGARQVTLGPRILRTETAGIAAAAALLALYGEME